MSPLRIAVVLALATATLACGKDEEIARDLTALEAFTKDVVAKVEGASDPAAGIDAGLAFIQQNREDMKARQLRVRANSSSLWCSTEMFGRAVSSFQGGATNINGLRLTLMKRTRDNPALEAKLNTLIETYFKVLTE